MGFHCNLATDDDSYFMDAFTTFRLETFLMAVEMAWVSSIAWCPISWVGLSALGEFQDSFGDTLRTYETWDLMLDGWEFISCRPIAAIHHGLASVLPLYPIW